MLETIPATYGFPVPSDGYLPGVASLCREVRRAVHRRRGADRARAHRLLWGVEAWGVEPDILVTGKGLSGGLYPIAAAVLTQGRRRLADATTAGDTSRRSAAPSRAAWSVPWCSTCAARRRRWHTPPRSRTTWTQGSPTSARDIGFLKDIRRKGLVMGLVFDAPTGGMQMMSALYQNGIWAIFAGFDHSVLQFKPGLFVDQPIATRR